MGFSPDRPGQMAHRPLWRDGARALGNVLLGLALGLASYYVITDLTAGWRQDALVADAAGLGAIASPEIPEEVAVEEPDPFDFTDWTGTDVAYWESLEEGGAFGRLVIERMDLDIVVVKGHSRSALKLGPGWIDYTDVPGPRGNVGISGHRTTYGAPFRRLDELVVGDVIDLYSPYRRYRYEVVRSFEVTPDQVEVVWPTPEPQLTLTACHPPYSAALRLIVQAELVEVRMIEGAP